MYSIIAPSFFQKKNCLLPGIGRLSLITHPAQTDFPNTQLLAPRQEIVFTPADPGATVFNEFSAISEMMRRHLEEEGEVELIGIGTFRRNDDRVISFEPVRLPDHFMQPVRAERVIHKHANHSMLVGDRETTTTAMSEELQETEQSKDRWWIWAIALFIAGVAAVAWYLYRYGVNGLASLS